MYCVFCGKSLDEEKLSAAFGGEGLFCCKDCYEKYVKKACSEETLGYGVLILSGDKGEAFPIELIDGNSFYAVVGKNPKIVKSGFSKEFPILFDEKKKEHNELATMLAKDNLKKGCSITGNALFVLEMTNDRIGLFTQQDANRIAWLINSTIRIAREETSAENNKKKG